MSTGAGQYARSPGAWESARLRRILKERNTNYEPFTARTLGEPRGRQRTCPRLTGSGDHFMIKVEITAYTGDTAFPVIVEFDVIPGCLGVRDSMGVPEEPDWPDELELLNACTPEGQEIDLNHKQQALAEQLAWKKLQRNRKAKHV